MRTYIFILFLGICSVIDLQAQNETQFYLMKALGAEIGSLHSTHEIVGEDHYYRNVTILDVNLIFKRIHMVVKNNSHYRQGQLIDADNTVTINDEIHSSSKVKWTGWEYSITVNEEIKEPYGSPVYLSGSLLYYQEPVNHSAAFSESTGIFMPIESMGDGKYRVTDPLNDRDMIRHYENGSQVKVEIKHTLLTLYMIRQDLESNTDE